MSEEMIKELENRMKEIEAIKTALWDQGKYAVNKINGGN